MGSMAAAMVVGHWLALGWAGALVALLWPLGLERALRGVRPCEAKRIACAAVPLAGVGWLLAWSAAQAPVGSALAMAGLAAIAALLRGLGPSAARLGGLLGLALTQAWMTPGVAETVHRGEGARALLGLLLVASAAVASTMVWLPKQEPDSSVEAASRRPPRSAAPSWALDPRRWPAPGRWAVQAGLAQLLAAGGAAWLNPAHAPWCMLSAYLVGAGAVARGEVLYKGLQRMVGAALGTLAVGLWPVAVQPTGRCALVTMVVMLALAQRARRHGEAWWAAGVTASLSLLYAQVPAAHATLEGAALLVARLRLLALGAVISMVLSWWVLPISTTSMFKRRLADTLAALGEWLAACAEAPADGARLRGEAAAVAARLAPLSALVPVVHWRWRLGRPDSLPSVRSAVATLQRCGAALPEAVGDLPSGTLRDARRLLLTCAQLRAALAGRGPVPAVPTLSMPDSGTPGAAAQAPLQQVATALNACAQLLRELNASGA